MRKKGRKIKNTIALNPLNQKRFIDFELPARAALLALFNNTATVDHLANLYTLGDMSNRIAKEPHIIAHAATVMRLCSVIHDAKCKASDSVAGSMIASANLLLDWMGGQRNADISKHAQEAIRELGR
jgi:hypothetical protein